MTTDKLKMRRCGDCAPGTSRKEGLYVHARATPGHRSKSSIHPKSISAQYSAHSNFKRIPISKHKGPSPPSRHITTDFTSGYLCLLFFRCSELHERHKLLKLSHTGDLVASRGRSFAERLIAVTRVPEGASPQILVSPVALHLSVKSKLPLRHSTPSSP